MIGRSILDVWPGPVCTECPHPEHPEECRVVTLLTQSGRCPCKKRATKAA